MEQVIDRWGSVTGTKDAPVRNLFLRGRTLVWRQRVAGQQLKRAVGVRRLRPGEALTEKLVASANAWIKKAEETAVRDERGIEALDGVRVRRAEASIGDVLNRYAEAALRLGNPSAATVRNNSSSLRLVVRRGLGLEESADVMGRGCSVLSGDLVEKFAMACLESAEDGLRARRSIDSTLRQARSVFAVGMMDEYRGLKLPDLSGFLRRRAVKAEAVRKVPYSPAEVDILRSGAKLEEMDRNLFVTWFLGYYCALRAGEIAQARADWIREVVPTSAQRQSGAWIGDRATVWVLDLSHDAEARLKNAASAGFVPLADDVAAKLRELAAGREFLIDADSPTGRHNVVNEDFNAWMRAAGWSRVKASHDLRAFRQQVWAEVHGEEIRKSWARHSLGKVQDHYLSGLNLSRRPLGLAE